MEGHKYYLLLLQNSYINEIFNATRSYNSTACLLYLSYSPLATVAYFMLSVMQSIYFKQFLGE